jgi:hypothetical protein
MMIKRWILTFFLLILTQNAFSLHRIPDMLEVNIDKSAKIQIDSVYFVPTNSSCPDGYKVTQNLRCYEFRKYSDEFQLKIVFLNKDSISSQVFHADEVKSINIIEKNGSHQFVISSVPEKKSKLPLVLINVLLFVLIKLLIPLIFFKPDSKVIFISGISLIFIVSVLLSIFTGLLAVILFISLEIALYLSLNKNRKRVMPVVIALLSSFLYFVLAFVLNFWLIMVF